MNAGPRATRGCLTSSPRRAARAPRYPLPAMTCAAPPPRLACALSQPGRPIARPLARVAALLASLAACADNPAFTGSGEPGATTTDPTGDASTGEPLAPCPGDQPYTKYWPDADQDGYGLDKEMLAEPTLACEPPAGMSAVPGDCNDKAPGVRPMVIEECNGFDDNCNKLVDEGSSLCGACTVELTKSFIYWVCPEKQTITWDAADARCRALGAKYPVRLASVHDQAEQDLLIGHLDKFDAVADEKHVWIGLRKRSGPDATCDPPTPDTDWVWSDNSSLDYLDWIPGEPNNQFCSVPDNLENCGELKQSSFPSAVGWNDTPCEFPGHGYICKARRDMIFIP